MGVAGGDAVRQLLAEISERAERATAAPWKAEYDGGLGERLDIVYVLGPDRSLLAVTQTMDNASEGKPFEDAAFIGAARQDVPRLVAALTAVLDLCAEREAIARQEAVAQEFAKPDRYAEQSSIVTTNRVRRAVAAALQEQP